jgi:FKBP-type peptidyl-prolyl cis-trans isomerase FklB
MKRIGMAILALGLVAGGASAQQAPAKSPSSAPTPSATSQTKGSAAGAAAPAKGQATAPAAAPAAGGTLSTQKEKLSYAIGMEMGKGVKAQGLDVDPALLTRGLNDALTDAKSLMTEDELRQVISALQQEIRQKQLQALEASAAENKAKGEAFLAENAKKEGVVSLPDGLEYKILTAGQGKKPAETDTVLCNYKGTFLDGTEFDSSARAGKPVPFEVKNVIPGFKEILQLMPVGSKWQVFIPSSLAYGERGAGNVIGPNATLIFEIELVGIQDTTQPAGGTAPADGPQTKE